MFYALSFYKHALQTVTEVQSSNRKQILSEKCLHLGNLYEITVNPPSQPDATRNVDLFDIQISHHHKQMQPDLQDTCMTWESTHRQSQMPSEIQESGMM